MYPVSSEFDPTVNPFLALKRGAVTVKSPPVSSLFWLVTKWKLAPVPASSLSVNINAPAWDPVSEESNWICGPPSPYLITPSAVDVKLIALLP